MKITCNECKNEIILPDEEVRKGKWFECSSCGVTYEVAEIEEDGTPRLHEIEEEK